jgi:hypothetical protein
LTAGLMEPTSGIRTNVDETMLGHLQIARRVERETYWTREIPGVSTFSVKGGRLILPEGLHSTWRTVNLEK